MELFCTVSYYFFNYKFNLKNSDPKALALKGNVFMACSIVCGEDVLNIWLQCGDILIFLFNEHDF